MISSISINLENINNFFIGKIEKKLINEDKSLINGKKLNISENEELLFGIDGNGFLNLWNNQK